MAHTEIRQLPEEGDMGALDAFIEDPLQELETEEGYELSFKELHFDVD